MGERDLESSVGQLLVELLDDDLSLLLEVLLAVPLESDSEDMLSALIDSGSLSDDLGRDNQIVEDFVVNAGQGSGVGDLYSLLLEMMVLWAMAKKYICWSWEMRLV